MQIGHAILMIARVLVEENFIWDPAWYHGLARNKAPLLYLLLRQSMFLLHIVVLNFYG